MDFIFACFYLNTWVFVRVVVFVLINYNRNLILMTARSVNVSLTNDSSPFSYVIVFWHVAP